MPQPLTPAPHAQIRLRDFDPRHQPPGLDREAAEAETRAHSAAIGALAYKLYAENRRAVLLVLQGMDTSGKDGTIRSVLSDVNPLSCAITAFKAPTSEELSHDFLWRIHRAEPRRGQLGVFNRSHYEDVLIVRVRNLVPEEEWRTRYDRINDFERLWTAGHVTLVKCFLHISKEEQKERLQARLDDPTKRWKFNPGDLAERELWGDYQKAAEVMLTRCNTASAPWHIVPADRKWVRNLVVSRLLRAALEKLDPQFPPAPEGLENVVVE
ncbi:MAG TPA: polyphosphate kinase 2 family protein [Lacipirellulaceae bacterium]|nr:polyphosphate kinase 2 family protein [Lacipirellulaceae bacterium]